MSQTAIIHEQQPKLDKPGAGLPFYEWFIAKYFLFPSLFRTTTKEQAIENFRKESDEILQLARGLSADELTERRLVPRLRGLEDSSRYWSVAMAIEHLSIVGGGTRNIIRNLSRGIIDMPPASTAAVKPHAEVDSEKVFEYFQAMTDIFVKTASAADFSKFPDAKFAHPWFGPLNAMQWLVFAAPHQSLHKRQIQEIIKRLH